MNTFGLKAFLRTISIFGSVYLLKEISEGITQSRETLFQIVYLAIAIVVALVFFVCTNLLANKFDHRNKKTEQK